jgi:hypothetical protein
MTLLSLVLSALSKESYVYTYENCIVHPVKKRRIKKATPIERYAAEVTVILFRNKFLDQVRDENRAKKIFYRTAYNLTNGWERRVKTRRLLKINGILDGLYVLESVKKTDDADEISNRFGEVLRTIMMIASETLDIPIPPPVYDYSFLLGKWIYLMDAFEDLEKDLEKWHYNPLLLSNKDLLLDGYDNAEIVKRIVAGERWRLDLLIDHMYDAYMRFEKYLGVYNYEIDGIISRAIPVMTRRILDKTIETPEIKEIEEEADDQQSV